MVLETYISDLLYRYDCVTIPGLGSFLAHKVSAKIHDTTHVFYPPKKGVSFNEQIQTNDGLLANYIAEIEKIPYEAALKNILKQVSYITSFLQQGETINFKNIGDLLLNDGGNIVFEPQFHVNFLTDAFGLAHFSSIKIERDTPDDVIDPLEDTTPTILTPQKRSFHWVKYAAAAVIAIGISSFFGAKYYYDSIETHNNLAQKKAIEHIETQIQEATFFIPKPLPSATLTVEKKIGNYHIVAGAFRVEANSIKKVELLNQKGYKSKAIGKNRFGLYEVIYGSFNTREEAQRKLYQIRRDDNSEAWLLIKALDL